jgi:hypothetical protein
MTDEEDQSLRALAVAMNEAVAARLARAFPELSFSERLWLTVEVIERMARAHGWSIRRDYTTDEEDAE